MNFEKFFSAYLACALWASVDDEGNSLDDSYGIEDFSSLFVASSRATCLDFFSCNSDMLERAVAEPGYSIGDAGHDFWLTRNGHGAGFWDRGLGKVGDALTKAAKVYGGVDLYVGDDGRVHGL